MVANERDLWAREERSGTRRGDISHLTIDEVPQVPVGWMP
jgi:hypothetical protein